MNPRQYLQAQTLMLITLVCAAFAIHLIVETPRLGVSTFNTFRFTGQSIAQTGILNVTSPQQSGQFSVGDALSIVVHFDQPVIITGKPSLTLETGVIDREAIYISGSSTAHIIFGYEVQRGDEAKPLNYTSPDAIRLNGGNITYVDGSPVDLTLPAVDSSDSLTGDREFSIDTIAPLAPTIRFPEEYLESTSSVVLFEGDGEQGTMVELSYDGSVVTTVPVSASGTWIAETPVLPPGVHRIGIRSLDEHGNAGPYVFRSIVLKPGATDLLTFQPPSFSANPTSPFAPERIASCPLFEQLVGALPTDGSSLVSASGAVQVNVGGRTVLYEDAPATAWFADPLIRLSVSYMVSGSPTGRGEMDEQTLIEIRHVRPEETLRYSELAKMVSLAGGVRPAIKSYADNPTAWGHWAEKYIARLEDQKIEPFGVIDIERDVTRGAFLQAVVDVFGISTEDLGDTTYIDLHVGHRFKDAIDAATRAGIVYGDTDSTGTFLHTIRSDDLINRAEAITILDRALRITCGMERAGPVVTRVNRSGQGRYGVYSNLRRGTGAVARRSRPATEWLSMLPMCERVKTVTPAATQSGYLVVSMSGTSTIMRDLMVGYSPIDAAHVLFETEVLGGTGLQDGYLVGSELITNDQLAGGTSVLVQSGSVSTEFADRERIAALFASTESVHIFPTQSFGTYDSLTIGAFAKMLTLAGDVPFVITPTSSESARYHWSSPYIGALEHGDISPFAGGGPPVDSEVTRGMFLQGLLEAFELPFGLTPREGFIDLYPGHRYEDAILSAAALGIVGPDGTRYGENLKTVRPNEVITRGEAVDILGRTVEGVCSATETAASSGG